jgi:ubiquitin fusion degradation protein 1
MLFKLINTDRNVHTHAGVLEFIAEEGRAYLPHWVRRHFSMLDSTRVHTRTEHFAIDDAGLAGRTR